MAEKGGYKHFMQKEIFEQPRAVRDTILTHLQDTGKSSWTRCRSPTSSSAALRKCALWPRHKLACGTRRQVHDRETRAHPVEVDYGSEFRYRDPILDSKTLTVCISQSGETADTLAAQREAKQKGSPTLAICNVMGSMVTREAAGTLLTHAGPEIGVASTKAFTRNWLRLFC